MIQNYYECDFCGRINEATIDYICSKCSRNKFTLITINHKYNVGDTVIWINDYGVHLGKRVIISKSIRTNKPTYYIAPNDAPWYDVEECNLHKFLSMKRRYKCHFMNISAMFVKNKLKHLSQCLHH